ncbi:alpha/beta hydrolase [Helicobacter sp. MIT 05-5294]|uniref:alpha/beta fold hydrolase n=1 Tax=Helicobacter sp. MIT 05-5294 TaxID=1548150 RepID=UPI00051FAC14|nr:alpha/beta hydrolase [Helicobacter sp. MIT 05-5294]TLD85857.1 alpha/beta hydrolase [Helicobacter sp. MIT 05-5294]
MAQKRIEYQGQVFTISYEIVESQNKTAPILVILHGWGASKALMKQAFGSLFQEFRHCYIDMPGFGNSPTPPFALNTFDYAEILKIFLKQLTIEPCQCTILGHSFGGKVATLLQPKELILLSSAGIRVPKTLKIRLKIVIAKSLNRLAPKLNGILKRFLRSKDVENMDEIMYQTFKNVVDEDFTSIFASFKNPCYIFWGENDLATPLKSGERIHSLIQDSKLFVLKEDHFFFLKGAKEIEKLYFNAKNK